MGWISFAAKEHARGVLKEAITENRVIPGAWYVHPNDRRVLTFFSGFGGIRISCRG